MTEKYFCCFRAKWRPADEQEEDNFLALPQRSEDWTPQGKALGQLPETHPIECKGTPNWQGKYRCAFFTLDLSQKSGLHTASHGEEIPRTEF
jgi:hypothetical protein